MTVQRIRHILVILFSARSFVFGFSLENQPRAIPITVLSGFLGSGKTSLLQNLLNNNQGLRIAVIVNDVASVNIDSKLVNSIQQQQQTGAQAPAGIVQLENGCACCSLSEELLGSVSELVLLSDMRGEGLGFDHIVVELSGIADPRGVRSKFQEAVLYDMPLMERVRLDTMVTLVDCSVFLDHLKNTKLANPRDSPELFYRPGEQPPENPLDWTEDIPAPLLDALIAGQGAYGSSGEGDSGVVDLLVSQCEIADVCLLNKVDLCEDKDLLRIESIVKALNPRATLFSTKFGRIPIEDVLAVAGGKGVVESGVVDDHKDAVKAALGESDPRGKSHSHDHDHITNGNNPICSDPSHSHEHEHQHSHSHVHAHDHDCEDPSHSHAQSSHQCDDPDCADPSHSHDQMNFGLGSFVYRARRPFHPRRLFSFLRQLPVSRGLPTLDGDGDDSTGLTFKQETVDALQRVLRSKGFVWCAHSDPAALYWSHAGTSFELNCLGRWWATLSRESWPPEAVDTILEDFVSAKEIDADPDLIYVGDRRQELVFIGPTLGESKNQQAISSALNQCLLDDEEWKTYCKLRNDDRSLQAMFPNPIESKVLTY